MLPNPTRRVCVFVLTTSVPVLALRLDLAAQAFLHVGERIVVGVEHLAQKSDVGDGKPQRVYLAKPLLVRERRHVHPQLVERAVYTAKHTHAQHSYTSASLSVSLCQHERPYMTEDQRSESRLPSNQTF